VIGVTYVAPMSRLRVSTVVDAPPAVVWEDLRHLDSHVEWMLDAVEIRFTSTSTDEVGTTFDCETRVGPFRLTDRMEVTRWEPGRAIGIRHRGVVTGSGVIRLARRPRGRTKVTWSERLVFPWWMGGPISAWLAVPVLRAVWRRSMRNLAARFDHGIRTVSAEGGRSASKR
jgi:hypothetical protein